MEPLGGVRDFRIHFPLAAQINSAIDQVVGSLKVGAGPRHVAGQIRRSCGSAEQAHLSFQIGEYSLGIVSILAFFSTRPRAQFVDSLLCRGIGKLSTLDSKSTSQNRPVAEPSWGKGTIRAIVGVEGTDGKTAVP